MPRNAAAASSAMSEHGQQLGDRRVAEDRLHLCRARTRWRGRPRTGPRRPAPVTFARADEQLHHRASVLALGLGPHDRAQPRRPLDVGLVATEPVAYPRRSPARRARSPWRRADRPSTRSSRRSSRSPSRPPRRWHGHSPGRSRREPARGPRRRSAACGAHRRRLRVSSGLPLPRTERNDPRRKLTDRSGQVV